LTFFPTLAQKSGRVMTVSTTEPGCQVYNYNHASDQPPHEQFYGICFETQRMYWFPALLWGKQNDTSGAREDSHRMCWSRKNALNGQARAFGS
jgi:galactose mutarotase-like enzyme